MSCTHRRTTALSSTDCRLSLDLLREFMIVGMDSFDFSQPGRSPRRELQGPRPPPLRVRKDSHKIKKPPVAGPPPSHASLPPQPPRAPVIIYAVSPKVIHTNPNEFMALVQRLTGPSPKFGATSSPKIEVDPFAYPSGAVSPAARYASLERAVKSPMMSKRPRRDNEMIDDITMLQGIHMMDQVVERTGMTIPGILSPGPSSLQPIPATFFSPPSDPNPIGTFIHDLSPAMLYNKSYFNFSDINTLLQSPTTFVSPRTMTSPFPSMDLFNNFFDL